MNEECGNLKVVIDGGELTRIISQKKSDLLQAYKSPNCEKCSRREHFFNKQMHICELIRISDNLPAKKCGTISSTLLLSHPSYIHFAENIKVYLLSKLIGTLLMFK